MSRPWLIALLTAATMGCSSGGGSDPVAPERTGGSGGASGSGGISGSGGTSTSTSGATGSGGAGAGTGGTTETRGPDAGAPDGGSADVTSGDGGAGNAEAFLGTWIYGAGMEKLECPAMMPIEGDLAAATLTFTRGTDSPLLLASPVCNLKFDAQASVATLRPGQTCSARVLNRPATFAPQTFTFTLEGNTTARQTGTWQVTFQGATPVVCTLVTAGTLSRQ